MTTFYTKKYAFSDQLGNEVTDALRLVSLSVDPNNNLDRLRHAFESLMHAMPFRKFTESFPRGIFSFLSARMDGITALQREITFKLDNAETRSHF
uniref:Uncharacterized protein n=1 Tax=Ditylenchus dipsaci TaxID=166011 RepID=A0A915CWN8_9BILA